MGVFKKLFGPKECSEHPLRAKAFQTTADELQLTKNESTPYIFGMIMEQAMPTGTATLVCFAEGSCSMYWGERGGIIGAGQHESVRRAAEQWISLGQETYAQASDSRCPKKDVLFVWRGFEGDRYVCVSTAEMLSKESPLRNFFSAAQNVVTQIRLVDQTRNG